MLAQFTWGQFLGCYGAVSLLWYLGLLFTAYRKEAAGLLTGRSAGPGNAGLLKLEPTKVLKDDFLPANVQGSDQALRDDRVMITEVGDGSGLMGKVSLPQGVEKVEISGLAFAPGADDEGDDGSLEAGLYGDLTGGIREIYAVLAANDGNKQDFFGMVAELKQELGPVGSSPCIPRVNAYIRDSAPFAISSEELESLWD